MNSSPLLSRSDLISDDRLKEVCYVLVEGIQDVLSNHFDTVSKRVYGLYKADIDSMWYANVQARVRPNNIKAIAATTKKTKQTTLREVTKKTKKYQEAPVLRKIQQNVQTIYIRRNMYGNYEHEPTGLVFDKDEKVVYGVQRGADVLDLSGGDLEMCKKYKFTPRIPENLDRYKENKINKIDEYDLDDDLAEEESVYDEDEEVDENEEDDVPDFEE